MEIPAATPRLPDSPRVFLIDGYALIYRAFYALIARPLTTSRGENTSAAWGIATFIQRLLTKHRPEYLGWVHDSGLSFRHERYPAYKATREKLSEELQSDFDRGMERICEMLEGYRIPVITLPGFEADDVIGTLAKQCVDQNINVVVVSGDKDFQQLVQPGVWLLNPGRGGNARVEEHWVGMENANERLGVPPNRVTDYLALVGDSSDNVPGVKGIGDKGACELVNEYGDLESILANVDNIKKKRPREALLEYADNARLSKELVTIRTDLDVTLDLDSVRIKSPDNARLRDLFLQLEFNAYAKEAGKDLGPEVAPPVDQKKSAATYTTVDTIPVLMKAVKRAREVGPIAIDTETLIDPGTLNNISPLRTDLISISIAVAPGEAYYFPLRHRNRSAAQGELLIDAAGDRAATDAPEERGFERGGDEIVVKAKSRAKTASRPKEGDVRNLPPLDSPEMKPFRDLLEDASIRKTAQNAKSDILALRRAGVTLRGLEFDTMLASYILDPGKRSHGLDVLALEFLEHTMISYADLCGKGKSAVPFDECPVEAARDYSCEDADMALQLRALFEPQMESQSLRKLLDEIELPLVSVLADMEWEGITIDLPWFASLKERFQRARREVEQKIYQSAGEEFNINSNPKLREILFEKLGLPVLKRTSTGPSTDASVLQDLADQGHTLPVLLMDYRELSKLENTYLDALPSLVSKRTGRLHTSFNQTVASTGRLSSSDPNLQNIPIRRELGRDIRKGFIPGRGWTLLAADYSQIELRLLAHLSDDPAFVNAFNAGGDIHKQTAAIIFEIDIADVSSEMRSRAKTINFATIYGQGPHALSRQLNIDHAEAKMFISTYFERFVGVRKYLDSMVEYAREHGYVQTIFGRRRYIPELRDRNFNIRAFGERTAANSPIQGSAADLIKIAMIRIANRINKEKLAGKMLLQVHDELVFEAPEEELEQLKALVREEMEGAAQLSIPLVVDLGSGANWLQTKL
ncbi:MAG: DNA polymerase I [Gemmatimonadaceae bacterium]|nr:DNA polymerase I [Gemmatimonadaceae bacterium]